MYKPLSEYGIIGNCRSCALVSDEGSIDWACLPNFDSPAYFCRILDENTGGFFKISPTGSYQTNQKYKENTNVLKTYFFNQDGSLSLTDFMPINKDEENTHKIPEYGLKFVRRLKAIKGEHKLSLVLKITPNFAKEDTQISKGPSFIKIQDKQNLLVLFSSHFHNFEIKGNQVCLDFNLKKSESKYFGLGFYKANTPDSQIQEYNKDRLRKIYLETQSFWAYWASLCKYQGEYQESVLRSALTLKLLTFNPTGAIVASPTTSLPEKIGGSYNWDYRYTWLRDASFTVYAFLGLGYINEARDFISWLENVCLKEGTGMLKIMYSISGEEELSEKKLDNLEGYMKSGPVRVGNGASNQLQFDIFGEVLTAIHLYLNSGGSLSEPMREFVKQLVDYCCKHWMEEDAGIWEERGKNKHNTYSKLMCWVGVDRGLMIAKRLKIDADLKEWAETKEKIKEDILKNGFNKKINSFVSSYGSRIIDTSTLNIPIFGLLPADDPKVLSTMEQVIEKLVIDWFVLRTSDEKNELREGEGAFFLSTFWLIDCLTMLGRIDEAKVWLERIIHDATPLGLYAEELDPFTKTHLGNFPQAFTHLGLINSVLNLYQAKNTGAKDKWSNQSDRLLEIFKTIMMKADTTPLTPSGIGKSLKTLLKKITF